MKKFDLIHSIVFFLASALIISMSFPLFTIQYEGLFRYHLTRIVIEKQDVYLFDALFGSKYFGFSIVTVLITFLIVCSITLSFVNLFKKSKLLSLLLFINAIILFCLFSSQNLLYTKQYGINTFNYLQDVENKYSFVDRFFEDTYLTKQCFYFDYGSGVYIALIITGFLGFFSFLCALENREIKNSIHDSSSYNTPKTEAQMTKKIG